MTPPPANASSATWTRYLERLVARDGGCLDNVDAQDRDILVWRTGLINGRPESQRQVAQRLGTSVARERQLERQAARDLRTSAASESCGGSGSLGTAYPFPAAMLTQVGAIVAPVTGTEMFLPAAASGAGSSRGHRSHVGRAPGHRAHPRGAGAGSSGALSGVSSSPSRATVPGAPQASNNSAALAYVVGGILLALIVLSTLGRLIMARREAAATAAEPGHGGNAPAGVARSAADANEPLAGSPGDAAEAGALAAGGVALLTRPESADDVSEEDAEPGDRPAAGAFLEGGRLADAADFDGAQEAFRRADELGHPAAASNYGALLERQGLVDGALAAYRRADARGDANGAFNLGGLLAQRGDVRGAMAAYRRAEDRGDASAGLNLGALLERQGDVSEAQAAYERARQRGDSVVAERARAALERLAARAGTGAA